MFVTRLVSTSLLFPMKTFKIQIFTHQFKRKKTEKEMPQLGALLSF